MRRAVIVRYSEIAVKGKYTRPRLERLLRDHVAEALERHGGGGTPERIEGRIIVWDPYDPEKAARAATRVFGVKSASPAVAVEFDGIEDLVAKAYDYFKIRIRGKFRVTARRSGSHDFTSLDVERKLGELLSKHAPVDLHNPEYTAYVEVRGRIAFFYDRVLPGPGGLPLGSEEPTLVLYSGGFDSTAAAWMIMRRGSPAGLAIFDVGVEEALENAVRTAIRLHWEWIHGAPLQVYIADFHDAVSRVRERVRPKYQVLILRRLMMLEAEKLALREGYEALATGESIGQVATQTVRNIRLIGSGLQLPVIRPVAGMDKDEVMALVSRIGLYDLVSRQVEACKAAVNPNPRPDPERFYRELGRVAGSYRVSWKRIRVGG